MQHSAATAPGNPEVPSEDWYAVSSDLVVVLDGATVRTETGCIHGAAWYAHQLGSNIVWLAKDCERTLTDVLFSAIAAVANLHPDCDLSHPGTPSAAVAIVQRVENQLRYLVLGDVSILVDDGSSDVLISDSRVSATASAQREEADRWLIGSPQKAAALLEMKHAELAARNTEGGYWIAATDPFAAQHAITGVIEAPGCFAVLTDGAARYVDLFELGHWRHVLSFLRSCGPAEMVKLVRSVESHDPLGIGYPRNKCSDDATVVFAQPLPSIPRAELPPTEVRRYAAERLLATTMNSPSVMGDGMVRRSV
jgi:hypothetical protein